MSKTSWTRKKVEQNLLKNHDAKAKGLFFKEISKLSRHHCSKSLRYTDHNMKKEAK